MSQKELAMAALARMSDQATFSEIVAELRFPASVRGVMKDLDQGLEIDHAEVKKRLVSWLSA